MKPRVRFVRGYVTSALVAISIFLSALLNGTSPEAAPKALHDAGRASGSDVAPVVCTIPIGGDAGVTYEDVGIEERNPWGPAALTIDETGDYWIADSAARRIQRYSKNCDWIQTIDLDELVVSIADVVVTDGEVWVLDTSAIVPQLVQMTVDGHLVSRNDIVKPLRDGLTGISADDRGLLLELSFGRNVIPLLDSSDWPTRKEMVTSGYQLDGRYVAADHTPIESADEGTGARLLTVGQATVSIPVSGQASGVRVLGSAAGYYFVLVEESWLDEEGVLNVDHTVRRYTAAGHSAGVARVPISERFVYVAKATAVAPDGTVYTMVPLADRVEIRRLRFSTHVDPLVPAPQNFRDGGELAES